MVDFFSNGEILKWGHTGGLPPQQSSVIHYCGSLSRTALFTHISMEACHAHINKTSSFYFPMNIICCALIKLISLLQQSLWRYFKPHIASESGGGNRNTHFSLSYGSKCSNMSSLLKSL